MINMQPGGRFQVSKTPQSLPGKCVVCGAWGGDGRDFVDFGFDIDFYGVVYFCSVCLTECCNKLGWINPSQWQSVNKMNDELIIRIQTLEADNVNLRNALSSTDFLRNGYRNDSNGALPEVNNEGTVSESTVLLREDDFGKKQDDPEFNGSSYERGPEDVSNSVKRDPDSDPFGFDL